MEYVSSCPVCSESVFSPYLTCRDHTVSNETFHLEKCLGCGLVITNPRPSDAELPGYYQSPAYISHSDRSHTLLDRAYKLARNFTLKWKYDLVVKYAGTKPGSILDFGCGTGAFLEECHRRGMRTCGIEPADLAREQAGAKIPVVKSQLDQVTEPFDAITLWHVLEHVSQLNKTLDDLVDHLTPNGTIFIAVPNLQSHDAAHYREHWAAYDVPRHLWHFSRSNMNQLMTRHRLKLVYTAPMPLDAFYVSLLSEKYSHGKNTAGNMARAILNGIRSNMHARKNHEYSSLIYIARK